MFPNNISKLKIHTDKIKVGFEMDKFYENKDILKKGYFRESIEEDEDTVTIIKEFISFDRSFSKKDKIMMDRLAFDELRLKGKDKEEVDDEIKELTISLNKAANEQDFEKCATLRDRIAMLKRIVILE